MIDRRHTASMLSRKDFFPPLTTIAEIVRLSYNLKGEELTRVLRSGCWPGDRGCRSLLQAHRGKSHLSSSLGEASLAEACQASTDSVRVT